MNKTVKLTEEYIAGTYARFPVNIVKGEGVYTYDERGKRYIDFGSGIGVNIFGFCDKEWTRAVTEQLSVLQHTSNLYYTEPAALLSKELCQKSGMKKVFFSNSGAEANECAIKAARKYAAENRGTECCNIITLEGSFHGRTVTTLAATGQEQFHKDFLPLTEGFKYVKPGDKQSAERLIKDKSCAAFMLETVQGEGGVNELECDYLKFIFETARENGVLVIVDEVQTGNGRTGEMYSYMRYGLKPDIVTTAKGLGGGLPIGATLLGEKCKDVFTRGSHGSTFGANPVAAAGALNVIKRLTPEFLDEVKNKGEYIKEFLSAQSGVNAVNGAGLMLGVLCTKPAAEVAAECLNRGLLVLTAKEKVRLLPPLNISYKEIDEGLKILTEALGE